MRNLDSLPNQFARFIPEDNNAGGIKMPAAEVRTNYWDLVRPHTERDQNYGSEVPASELGIGDVFITRDKTWLHCGWYSAVGHICGFSLEGSGEIVSRHGNVALVRKAEPEEAIAIKNAVSGKAD
jgi:hypothetical protein